MKRDVFAFLIVMIVFSFAYAVDGSVTKDGISVATDETQVANIATTNNKNSQNSMLELANDIGIMADRINQMADKIVKTQEIQSQNLKFTEENILKAQKAIASALKKTNDPEIIKELQSAKSSLENIISIKNKKLSNKYPTNPKTTKKVHTNTINIIDGFNNTGEDMGGMSGGGMGLGGF